MTSFTKIDVVFLSFNVWTKIDFWSWNNELSNELPYKYGTFKKYIYFDIQMWDFARKNENDQKTKGLL